jgi:uncharacterized protein
MTKAYPAPRADADNAAFLEGWHDGTLVIQSCAACGRSIFYPRPLCPHCWSDRLENRTASGDGRIVGYSLVYRPNDAAFDEEIPIVLAEIELAEGASLIARIVGSRREELRSGRPVRLARPDAGEQRYPLPVFELASTE